jgi:hypothetical protein
MISQCKKVVLSVTMLGSLCGGYMKASETTIDTQSAAFRNAVKEEVNSELDRREKERAQAKQCRKTEEEQAESRKRMAYEKHMLDTELGSFSSFVTTIGILGGVLAFFVFITSRTTPSTQSFKKI